MSSLDTGIAIPTGKEVSVDKIGAYLWLSFVVCFFCNVFAGLISTLMPAYLPTVVRDLSGEYTPRISAIINSLYIVGWTIGGFTWGYISDRIGRSRAITLSVGALGLLTLTISFAPSWEYVVAIRLLSGFAVGGILVVTPTLLSEIWPVKSRSIILGIDSIGFPVGIFSTGIINYLVSDWRQAFFIGAAPLIVGLLSLWILRESDNWQNSKNTKIIDAAESAQYRSNLIRGAIIFGSMLIGLWGMFSWIPSWIQSMFTAPKEGILSLLQGGAEESGIAMMLLGIGGLSGGFFSGWISNALGVRKAMLLCFSGCFIVSFLLFGMNKTFSTIIYPELALLSLFFGISQGLLSIYIPQLFPYHIRGTYTGICFNIGRIVTSAAVFFIGVFVTALGGYGNALLCFAGIFIIGFAAVYLTKDQAPQKN